jgi:hypothetical protein
MGRSRTIHTIMAEMQEWPDEWNFRSGDRAVAQFLVNAFRPFLQYLHVGGMALSTIERHRNFLGMLGLTIMEDRQDEPPTRKLPALLEIVEEEGGPLSNHRQSDTEERQYHATCKKLYKFLSGSLVVKPRRKSLPRSLHHLQRKSLPLRKRPSQLDAMVEEATMDANSLDEVISGFLTAMEEHLALPFRTTVLGQQVLVSGLDSGPDDVILAVCQVGKLRQRIPLLELPLPTPPPAGHRWIQAYRKFHG